MSFVESLPTDGDWHVHHSAHGSGGLGFQVRISLSTTNLNLPGLVLPEMRSAFGAAEDGANQTAAATKSEVE